MEKEQLLSLANTGKQLSLNIANILMVKTVFKTLDRRLRIPRKISKDSLYCRNS